MSIKMTRRQRTATVIAAGVVAVGITVGVVIAATGQEEPTLREPVATAEPSATTEPTTPAPTEAATPEPVIPTGASEIVPADMIDAARDAGAFVYVSPNGDGSGVVVDPAGALPEQVQADITSLPSQPSTMQDVSSQAGAGADQNGAMIDAGLQAFYVRTVPVVEGTEVVGFNWAVYPFGISDGAKYGSTIAPTREGALALAAPMFAAYPGVPVIG